LKQPFNEILWLTCFNFSYIFPKRLNMPDSVHLAGICGYFAMNSLLLPARQIVVSAAFNESTPELQWFQPVSRFGSLWCLTAHAKLKQSAETLPGRDCCQH
jgi:hypothetical protein